MSVVRGFGLNGKSYYTNVSKPQEVLCQFTVASTNANGWGLTSLKSNGYVNYAFMNTTQPAGIQNGVTNPNPIAGFALIGFTNPFNKYLQTAWSQSVPAASSANNTTAGHAYYITALGTTTLAQWLAAGYPQGLTPTVGQAFVATATGAIGGTGTVGTPGVPVITSVTALGDPNQTITNSNIAQNGGAQLVLQFNAATAAGNTDLLPTAPADGTVFSFNFVFDGSSVTIDGL